MSGTNPVFRPAGQTVALSVVGTSHAAVPLPITTNDMTTYVALLNAGSIAVAVRISTSGSAATLPIDGTPGDWILPAAMQEAVVLPLPSTPFAPAQITAIGSGAGPTIIYATPVVMQT